MSIKGLSPPAQSGTAQNDIVLKKEFTISLVFSFIFLLIFSLPLLNRGFGGDIDCWLIARCAQEIAGSGRYSASRTTGFPLYEIINTPLIRYGGWLAANIAALVVACICAFIFGRIALKMKLPHPGILTFLFVFFPHFLRSASITLDYGWTLTLGLAGFWALLDDKEKMAGVLVGLSAGFRPTGILLAVPFSLWLNAKKKSPKRIFNFVLLAGLVGLAAYGPALSRYGVSRLLPSSYAPTLAAPWGLMAIL